LILVTFNLCIPVLPRRIDLALRFVLSFHDLAVKRMRTVVLFVIFLASAHPIELASSSLSSAFALVRLPSILRILMIFPFLGS